MNNKLITASYLADRSFTLSLANGCFDLLGIHHLRMLTEAATFADRLVVAVNSDRSVKELKGNRRPIIPLEERLELLAGLACVDYVIAFDESSPIELIKKIRPEVLAKGCDWLGRVVAGSEYAGRVEFIQLTEGYSTTRLIKKIGSVAPPYPMPENFEI